MGYFLNSGTVGQHADSLALKRLVDADRCGQYRKSSVVSFTTVHRGFAVQVALSVPCPLCEQSPADNTAGEQISCFKFVIEL